MLGEDEASLAGRRAQTAVNVATHHDEGAEEVILVGVVVDHAVARAREGASEVVVGAEGRPEGDDAVEGLALHGLGGEDGNGAPAGVADDDGGAAGVELLVLVDVRRNLPAAAARPAFIESVPRAGLVGVPVVNFDGPVDPAGGEAVTDSLIEGAGAFDAGENDDEAFVEAVKGDVLVAGAATRQETGGEDKEYPFFHDTTTKVSGAAQAQGRRLSQ